MHRRQIPDRSPLADPSYLVALPRVTGLAISPDGVRLVAVVAKPDAAGSRYVSSLWELDPAGSAEPRQLTRSEQGEGSPAFRPDGTLVFTSTRTVPGLPDGESAVWQLPAAGESTVLAASPGGLSGPVVASDGAVLVAGSRLPGSSDAAADRAARTARSEQKVTAILHDGMPIRYWDHELADVSPRLFLTGPDGEIEDLFPTARGELVEAGYSITGTTVATTWSRRLPHGRTRTAIRVLDRATDTTSDLGVDGADLTRPRLSPDGARLAVLWETEGDYDTPFQVGVAHFDLGTGERHDLELGDLYPTELAWSTDSATLLVAGDRHGRGAVEAFDMPSGKNRTLADDASYSNLCPAPDGTVFALRTTPDSPPTPARLRTGDELVLLPSPGASPELPGRLIRLSAVAADGAQIGSWLAVPHDADDEHPAPVQLWIHGGPFASWNAWSWRWNPWVAVARGYAVLLPDPGLSTGYGPAWIARGWPHRAAVVWADLQSALDAALARPDLDGSRTACLGASFGGYMTNWIAGHTTRFAAIVTHAGLWALDQQHATTDAAAWKSGLFGLPAEHPDWYAQNSPHNFADHIVTPMLIVHGNRDYRVPVSEALRLWWDLVSRHDGDPADLPHRFLQFTGENHWVLSPANSRRWYDTVQGFVDRHVRPELGAALSLARPDPASFERWTAAMVVDYAAEIVAGGVMDREAAERKSRADFAELLPDGLESAGQHIYRVVDPTGAGVGWLWLGPPRNGAAGGWVYDVSIDEAHRGKGFGRQAMLLAEQEAPRLGWTALGLNVFGNNDVARSLYDSLGYRGTAQQMSKQL